mmetsp:Transcript_51604/g.96056  ORF Transcript_51604/g.96056 Transcript_51604/m.96056 type:complete len:225 (+) Transcript_51604:652-1326(+)
MFTMSLTALTALATPSFGPAIVTFTGFSEGQSEPLPPPPSALPSQWPPPPPPPPPFLFPGRFTCTLHASRRALTTFPPLPTRSGKERGGTSTACSTKSPGASQSPALYPLLHISNTSFCASATAAGSGPAMSTAMDLLSAADGTGSSCSPLSGSCTRQPLTSSMRLSVAPLGPISTPSFLGSTSIVADGSCGLSSEAAAISGDSEPTAGDDDTAAAAATATAMA